MTTTASILLVDDRPSNLTVLEAILEPLGQRLVRAASGPEALRRLLAEDFALILLDVQMPGMDGFETATLIKQRERSRATPIIFVTALPANDRYIYRGYTSGAVDYIFKPLDPDILRSKVSVFVELFQQAQLLQQQAEQLRRSELREAERQARAREKARRAREMQKNQARQQDFLRDVLTSVTGGKLRLCDSPADLPPPLPDCREPIPLSPAALSLLRRRTSEAADAVALPRPQCQDIVTAVSEAAMNAVVHGGGGLGRICAGPEGPVQVWIEDQGGGIAMEHLPRATLERGFTTAGTLGHGFWMILNLASRVWLLTGRRGTTVVLEQDHEPPSPAWPG